MGATFGFIEKKDWMESPFGNVCGLDVSGTIHNGDTVKLLVRLRCDADFNIINAIQTGFFSGRT